VSSRHGHVFLHTTNVSLTLPSTGFARRLSHRLKHLPPQSEADAIISRQTQQAYAQQPTVASVPEAPPTSRDEPAIEEDDIPDHRGENPVRPATAGSDGNPRPPSRLELWPKPAEPYLHSSRTGSRKGTSPNGYANGVLPNRSFVASSNSMRSSSTAGRRFGSIRHMFNRGRQRNGDEDAVVS
jgi:hypothetical protein